MKKIPIRIFVFAAFAFAAIPAFAQSVESPLIYEGGADNNIYKTDTVILENTVLDDCSSNMALDSLKVGLSQFHSPFIKMFYLPVSYKVADYIELNMTLPYITKSVINGNVEYQKSGYGDIKLGAFFLFEYSRDVDFGTRVNMTFPTGDEVARDADVLLPTGYGSSTFSLLQAASVQFTSGVRFFCNIAGVYYSPSTLKIDTNQKNKFKQSYMYSGLIGIEKRVSTNFVVQLKGNYIKLPDRQYKYENTLTNASTDWVDLGAETTEMNVIAALKYNFLDDISGSFMVFMPFYQKFDSNIDYNYDKNWKLYFNLEKRFGDYYDKNSYESADSSSSRSRSRKKR